MTTRNNWPLIWAVSFAVWLFVSFAATGSTYELYRSRGIAMNFSTTLGAELSQILTYAPLTPLVFALAIRYPVQRRNWIRRSSLHLAAGVVFSVAHITLRALTPYGIWDSHTGKWASALWDPHAHAIRIQWYIFQSLFYGNVVDDVTGTYVPILLAAHAVSYYQIFRARELRSSQLEAQLAMAHLAALKSQLRPHFLFNTLHSITALMHTDVNAADKMMARLSDLLRMSLDNNEQVTTLNHELEFVGSYLEIEKVRFADRLKVVLDIAPDTLDAQIPHLLLQPLVENAVRHGVSRLSSQGEIRVTARHDGHSLYLQVTDNGPGLASADNPAREGIGLATTRQRLQTLYGEDQHMDIRDITAGGVEVQLRLPFRLVVRPIEKQGVSPQNA
ncbi:MAG: histidine kinase [Candidatus Sulfotelmatobacter sp.]